MPRIQCRLGDIFEAKRGEQYRYFQFVALDQTQLNSDVIAVFEGSWSTPQLPEFIIGNPVAFFVHTMVRFGVPSYWQKVGKAPLADHSKALFKDAEIEGHHDGPMPQQPFEGPSNHWSIWHINEASHYVGNYKNVPQEAELGLVFQPKDVYNRIFDGDYHTEGAVSYYGVYR